MALKQLTLLTHQQGVVMVSFPKIRSDGIPAVRMTISSADWHRACPRSSRRVVTPKSTLSRPRPSSKKLFDLMGELKLYGIRVLALELIARAAGREGLHDN
jgi:hypothetical protein